MVFERRGLKILLQGRFFEMLGSGLGNRGVFGSRRVDKRRSALGQGLDGNSSVDLPFFVGQRGASPGKGGFL